MDIIEKILNFSEMCFNKNYYLDALFIIIGILIYIIYIFIKG